MLYVLTLQADNIWIKVYVLVCVSMENRLVLMRRSVWKDFCSAKQKLEGAPRRPGSTRERELMLDIFVYIYMCVCEFGPSVETMLVSEYI